MNPLVSPEQALQQILASIQPVQETESLPLSELAGRVLAEEIIAEIDVPPADNSAMDGYALRLEDQGQALPVTQRLAAGQAPQPLAAGQCARLFTGSEIPPGANCVVMQEKVRLDDQGRAVFPTGLTLQDNIRRRGQDIRQGQSLLAAGTRLDYRHLGLIASVGLTQARVLRPIRVALLATGDELAAPGEPLKAGQIYNSNRPLLTGLLHELGAKVIDLGRIPDDREATEAALSQAADQADLILSTGGVSVGEEDHIKPAVDKLGELSLWRLAMKPGKPLAFGRIGQAAFLGLPGNPVSSFVTAQLFLRPVCGRLSGSQADWMPRLFKGQADFYAKTQIRQEYLRVLAVKSSDSSWQLSSYANQNSGVLSSVVWANALAIIPPETEVQPSQEVSFFFYS